MSEPPERPTTANGPWQRRPEVAAVRRRSVATLASGQMLASLAIGVGPSVGVLLAAEVTHSEAWAGIARASMTIGAAAVALPLAAFAAARGRRPALTLAFAIATFGAALVALSAQALIAPWAASLSAPLFIVGMLAMGFGSAASFQARFAGADLAEPARRGRTLALVVWAGTVGAVLGPSLARPGEALAIRLGWHPFAGAFAIAAVLAGLTTLLIATFLRPDPLRLAQRFDATPSRAAAPSAATRGRAAYRRAWRAICAAPRARAALLAQVLAHLVMVSIMTMTPVHLHHGDHGLGLIGVVISLHVAGMWAFAPIFGYGSDRLGPRRMILIGVAIQAASCAIAVVWAHSTLGVAAALFLLGLGWSAVTVPAASLLTQAVPSVERPYVQGFGDFLMNAVAALGAAISGPVMAFLDFRALAALALLPIVWVALANVHRAPAKTRRRRR